MKYSIEREKSQQRSNLTQISYPQQEHYTIEGPPVPLARPRLGRLHTYDSQKQIKYSAGIQLVQQHQGQPLFTGPLQLDVTFFMPIPERLRRQFKGQHQSNELAHHPHCIKPDIDNLIKFLLDISNKTLVLDDAQFSVINARKLYSMISRTEFTISRLETT
jgi:Holliday junction resolvase RusA-like endonuclease